MSFKNTWLFSLLSHIDVILVLRFTKWVICLLILTYGLLDVYRHYLKFLVHPDWSAAHYVVFIYIIPYIFYRYYSISRSSLSSESLDFT